MNARHSQLHDHGARTASGYVYEALAEDFFYILYRDGAIELPFLRDNCAPDAKRPRVDLPRNPGGSIKKAPQRMGVPASIVRTQPPGKEWVIERRGKSGCAFRLLPINRILPNPQLAAITIPDATPEIISAYALPEEQALLAKVRYNKLLELFLGVATYSLQHHFPATVTNLGKIEIDEIYVAVDKRGRQYVIPVQAKRGNDRLSTLQTRRDIACCAERFPNLICRAISAQFVDHDLIAILELARFGEEIKIVEERHYRLVPSDEISAVDLKTYDSSLLAKLAEIHPETLSVITGS